MKRRRQSPRPLAQLEARLWGGSVIPPLSVVRLIKSEYWLEDVPYRIGYYSHRDGLNVVWLVNDSGEYIGTVDQPMIRKRFAVLQRSDETDHYGKDRPIIESITRAA